MKIPVGPHQYKVVIDSAPILFEGQLCDGLCDSTNQTIRVAASLPVSRRISVCWHELAHAWKAELDIHQSQTLDEETMANLIGLAMAAMTPALICRLHCYLAHNIDAPDVIILPRVKLLVSGEATL